MALYLITCPNASMIGMYYLPLPTLCHETKITARAARKALDALTAAGFAVYDEQTEYVWVPEMARYQIGDSLMPGDKRIPAIRKALGPFWGHPFAQQFIAKYGTAFHLSAMPLACTSEGPSETLRSQEQDQEQKHEQEHERTQERTPAGVSENGLTPEGLKVLWNEIVRTPRVRKLSAKRLELCRVRIHESPDPSWWRKVFEEVAATPFLRGDGPNGWRADFDWIIEDDTNALKVAEGNYERASVRDMAAQIEAALTRSRSFCSPNCAHVTDITTLPGNDAGGASRRAKGVMAAPTENVGRTKTPRTGESRT